MKGRTLLALTSSLAALAVAAPGAAVAKQGGTDRPLQGSASSTDTNNLVTGAGTGQGPAIISHLGRGTFAHSFTAAPTGPNTLGVAGTETYTAANGDQVFATFTGGGTFTGLAVGETAQVTGVATITGGTGRFAGASGTLTVVVDSEVASLAGATLVNRDTLTVQGRISY
jgi:hypothetical protein